MGFCARRDHGRRDTLKSRGGIDATQHQYHVFFDQRQLNSQDAKQWYQWLKLKLLALKPGNTCQDRCGPLPASP